MGLAESGMCGSQSLPLPCTRGLWAAESNAEWKKRYEQFHKQKKSGKFLTLLDLATFALPSNNNTEHIAEDSGIF